MEGISSSDVCLLNATHDPAAGAEAWRPWVSRLGPALPIGKTMLNEGSTRVLWTLDEVADAQNPPSQRTTREQLEG